MVKCTECYYADRDPETEELVIHEEADIFAKIKPGQAPPKVRVVKSCQVGAGYFKTYGSSDHTCNKFASLQEYQKDVRKQLEKDASGFTLDTTRKQLVVSDNILALIEQMTENDNNAYMVLLDAFSTGMGYVGELITNLDDMNIRGPQVQAAYEYCDNNITKLRRAAEARDEDMIAYINDTCDTENIGPAVVRFASEFGHKGIDSDGNNSDKAGSTRRIRVGTGKRKH